MTRASAGRWFHALTFAVAVVALVLQLVQVCRGSAVLNQTEPPDLDTRLVRPVSYLTIWSNALVAWSTLTIAVGRDRDTRRWRALRIDAVLVCAGGGVVHFFLLRPILDLHGADALADHLLHQVVPALALLGWLAFGPRARVAWNDLLPFLAVPVAWFAYTVVRGAWVGWYPYPFVDVDARGYLVVAANGVGVAALLVLLFVAARAYERLRVRNASTTPTAR